jgi:two-component system, NarL family, nitrate/nitrite response regulator NarL
LQPDCLLNNCLTTVTKILIVDDHPLVRDGIQTMLKDEPSINITGSCKTAAEALDFLLRETPDIILLDISLPDMNGLELCERVRLTHQHLKNMERAELLVAIETVLKGKVYLSAAANEKLLEQFQRGTVTDNNLPLVTRREKEILQLLSDGLNGPQISEKLFLSPLTVETHRKNLFKKFNATSVQGLLKMARDHKLV